MIGYLLFMIPMGVAFIWVAGRNGIQQALLDLIAFNLLFSFDLAALMPGNIQLTIVQLLGVVFVGYEMGRVIHGSGVRLPRRAVIVLGMIAFFTVWSVGAAYLNRGWEWTRITINVTRIYILPALFVIVGICLAKSNGFTRFARILLYTIVVVGIIAIIQTASNGTVLTNDQSDNYLGIFQPLGDKAIAWRDLGEEALNYVNVVRTIHFGSFSLYRAPGAFDGEYILLCIIAIVAVSLLTVKATTSWRLLVSLFFSVVGFLVAFNRTAVVTFTVLTAAILLVRFRSLFSLRIIVRWLIPISLVAFIAIALVTPISTVIEANLDGFFGSRGEKDVGTLTGRTLLWGYVVPEIISNPIVGSGRPITLELAGWGHNDNPDIDLGTHNGFLEFAYRGGIPSAFTFVLLVFFCLWRAWSLSKDKRLDASQRSMFFALACAMAGFVLLNLTAVPMDALQTAGLFWICCGYLAAYKSPSSVGLRYST